MPDESELIALRAAAPECPICHGPCAEHWDGQKDDNDFNDRKGRADERRKALAHGLACDQRDAWEGLALGLDRLLAHYRSGSTPSGALLDRIREARERVASLQREARDA